MKPILASIDTLLEMMIFAKGMGAVHQPPQGQKLIKMANT